MLLKWIYSPDQNSTKMIPNPTQGYNTNKNNILIQIKCKK
jgi:hypothetical protein